jgi:cell division protease FtsH
LSATGGAFYLFWSAENKLPVVSYNDFLENLENNEIAEVNLKGGEIKLTDTFGRKFATFSPDIPGLMPDLLKKNVIIRGESESPSPLWPFFSTVIPLIFIIIAWYSLANNQKQDDSSEFAKDKEIQFSKRGKQVTFRDVAGVVEAKEELIEIIDFLQKPKKYSRLGAIIPRGVLFQGPPGTGKTLLARAIAGEAGVPFFSISGSDFVEMFVGVGASRVRDLFKEAKKNTPCIIFIDEIDAVGGHRSAGASAGGGQDERGQTLNALLVEMDGFNTSDTIIILAATNRPDILDPALLRPGRFDRQITILPPDVKGRLKILEVHARRVPMGDNVDLEKVARSTPGFTGAELASLINESALIAGRKSKKNITSDDIEFAKDRILMGVERKGMVINEKDRKTMAYHEAGHAILAKLLPEADPLHKMTIIPRGKAMGHTQQLPLSDRHAYSREYLNARIVILMGGRVAEEVALNQKTTGAEDDFQQAVKIASQMICKWGMDDELGPVSYASSEGGFLGDQMVQGVHSDETARQIDRQVKKLIETCYREAESILSREKDFLESLAQMLLLHETLDSEEMEIIYSCTLRKRKEKESVKSSGIVLHEQVDA